MKNNFRALKRKLFSRVLLIGFAGGIIGFLLVWLLVDGVLQKPFASFFMNIAKSMGANTNTGLNLYQTLIRENKIMFLAVGAIILLLILFYITLSRITRYFSQINDVLGQVMTDDDTPIRLPEELRPVTDQLNEAKIALQKQKQQAREAEQRKNDLVVYLAHDLKTPLTSVIGYLSLLTEAPDMPVAQRAKYNGIALEKAYRLEDLINEFFEITRFNLQNESLETNRVNLSVMLCQLADEFYPLLSPKQLSISLAVEPDLLLTGDANKLARVFDNILRNAINYCYENSELTLSAVKKARQIIVSISNPGDPIPPHKLSRIFEKFYRLDSSRSSKTGGAGLGLAIAKEIVELHNGTIEATSNAQETVFTIALPCETVRNT